MIAAIYSRKSTEQHSVADEQKSVPRHIEHARQYVRRKSWTVDDGAVFVDDGISGAEFANRPGFLRLMNALKPRVRFQVLVMSEESRLGREAIKTAYSLKQLVQAGVREYGVSRAADWVRPVGVHHERLADLFDDGSFHRSLQVSRSVWQGCMRVEWITEGFLAPTSQRLRIECGVRSASHA